MSKNNIKQLKKDLNLPNTNLGRVTITHSYVVDLNNKDMVEDAKNALFADLCSAYSRGELIHLVGVIPDKKAKADEIPEFLLDGDSL